MIFKIHMCVTTFASGKGEESVILDFPGKTVPLTQKKSVIRVPIANYWWTFSQLEVFSP